MLKRISIKGYKSIKDATIELKPINILIGANGVGKSNFVSFFKLVNNIYEQNLQGYSLACGLDSLLYYGRKRTDEIYGLLDFGSNGYEFSLKPTNQGTLYISKEVSLYSGSSITYPKTNILESTIKTSTYRRNAYLRDRFSSYKIYHFHDTEQNSMLRAHSCNIDDNQRLKPDAANLPAFLYYLKQKNPTALKRMEMIIRSVMPYFDRFDLHPKRLDNTKIGLEWRDKTDLDKYFDAADLSDGSLRFMALTALLMQPDMPQTIIIDEPELGLHPVAISKLASMIKSASKRNSQLIVSTQSADLISYFNPEDVITVDRSNGQTTYNRLKTEDLKLWLDNYSLGELWSRSIISGQPKL